MHYADVGYKNYAELARFAPEPSDAEETAPYNVVREEPETTFLAHAINTNIASFDTKEQAMAAIGNLEFRKADMLYIEHEGEIIWEAAWDETVGRYLSR